MRTSARWMSPFWRGFGEAFMIVYVSAFFLLLSGRCAMALPYQLFDARSVALGGTTVATDVRNAPFYNPALMAVTEEEFDWYLMMPSVGQFKSDPDDVEDGLDELKKGADVADVAAATVDGVYEETNIRGFTALIPSPVLAGAAYFVKHKYQTLKVLGADADAQARTRAIDINENGFSIASAFESGFLGEIMVGLSAKLMLIDSYGYTDPLSEASFNLRGADSSNESDFNFDFGVAKEVGVWKFGFAAKNILKHDYHYGNSSDDYSIGPQGRVGFAYQSRYTVFEVDVDILKNEGVGDATDTQFAAVGWEWRMFPGFYLRLGANQNFIDDTFTTLSGGIGLHYFNVLVDVAYTKTQDGDGVIGQLGFKF